ncbi:hypothetical protein DPMN_001429 [Dreissena polymorpha]|uniref:Uncharacterized protein n=1 Tax=Dreissena polymorpha TaxID=45954 RepID=A0A9D4MK13_DREPO|nr:hypothetical protein DPMN_001429 [Dreissena polymorpha]
MISIVSQTMIELKDCAADAACAVPGESHCLGQCGSGIRLNFSECGRGCKEDNHRKRIITRGDCKEDNHMRRIITGGECKEDNHRRMMQGG